MCRRAIVAALLVAAGVHVAAQGRLTVKATSGYDRPATTWLFAVPDGRLEWTGAHRLLNGVFTATGRYFIAAKAVSASLQQLWMADLVTGAVATHEFHGYNGAYVTANPRVDEAYVQLVQNTRLDGFYFLHGRHGSLGRETVLVDLAALTARQGLPCHPRARYSMSS